MTTRPRTNHAAQIRALREVDTIESRCAADLLEVHDDTGLNLYAAPNWLAFVKSQMEKANIPAEVTPNYV